MNAPAEPRQKDIAFSDAHASWHAEVEAARTAPFGPLSAVGLFWLTPTPQQLSDLPGLWSADETGLVTVEVRETDGVTQAGVPVAGTVTVGPLTDNAGSALAWGNVQIEIAARSGGIIVRPRTPDSPDRTGYTGTNTFPAQRDWVITGRFVPAERDVTVASAAGADRTHHFDSAGVAEFTVGETPVSLTLFGSAAGDDLRAVFADASGADLSYPAARFVDAELLDDHTVRIDFNRATNPPCAYSDSATCPFPPPENRLQVRIEAGELRPGVTLPA